MIQFNIMKSFIIFFLITSLFAMIRLDIPRSPTGKFVKEGIFEGGTSSQANLENIRMGLHQEFERWVFDFSDIKTGKIGEVAPKFQIRITQKEKPTLILTFQSIEKVLVTRKYLHSLLRKSNYVKDVILYPAIEDGDIAIEFILNDKNMEFYTHQPLEPHGRLVVDIRRSNK